MRAEANRDDLPMDLAEFLPLDIKSHQVMKEIEQTRVLEVDWRMDEFFPVYQVGVNSRFKPSQKVIGSPQLPMFLVRDRNHSRHGRNLCVKANGSKVLLP